MSISGKWRITEMGAWDREAIDLVGPAFIEFRRQGGEFHFDECDPASGRGWAKLLKDGSLSGHIYFHRGDDSSFKAIRYREEEKPRSKTNSTGKRGLR